jgi:hypothetical protein
MCQKWWVSKWIELWMFTQVCLNWFVWFLYYLAFDTSILITTGISLNSETGKGYDGQEMQLMSHCKLYNKWEMNHLPNWESHVLSLHPSPGLIPTLFQSKKLFSSSQNKCRGNQRECCSLPYYGWRSSWNFWRHGKKRSVSFLDYDRS